MDVCEAGRIGNDGVRHKGLQRWIHANGQGAVEAASVHVLIAHWCSHAIASFNTRPPAAGNDFVDASPPLAYISALQRVHTGHKARVLDHESHKFRRVSADTEELQAILCDELFECWMG